MDGLGPWWRNLSEQEQLAQILENCSLWVFDPETAKVFENAIERLFYTQEYRIGKAVLPQANVRSRLWDLDSTILQSVEGKLRQNQRNVKNSTAYTMAVIFNAICESQSDLLLDPYLNSIGGAPAGGEKGGEIQCFRQMTSGFSSTSCAVGPPLPLTSRRPPYKLCFLLERGRESGKIDAFAVLPVEPGREQLVSILLAQQSQDVTVLLSLSDLEQHRLLHINQRHYFVIRKEGRLRFFKGGEASQ